MNRPRVALDPGSARTDASGAEIESAYHARLAAADRVRFDSNASPADRRLAEQQRARVNPGIRVHQAVTQLASPAVGCAAQTFNPIDRIELDAIAASDDTLTQRVVELHPGRSRFLSWGCTL